MERKVNYLVNWLREQFKQANVKGLVVGLSGGLDSALVANLIKQAVPDHSLAVIMPCESQTEDLEHARALVEQAQIADLTIDLTDSYQQLYQTIHDTVKVHSTFNQEHDQLARANLKARLRMATLYTIATNHQYLVVGTDNAAEWYTGYFTKYGDGGVDINPLVHLTKNEVKQMAEFVGVPSAITEKQPSAGLWEGQTDEDEMGTSYDYIDRYLKGESVPERDREIIERMHHRSAHKRKIAATPDKFNG
ncbi:NAD(+) synthase [Amphibacillus indicireducens]|uniref:NH(3)-dependent NAD(+) synthetase n=1 Tax=Amphibacillus indicireducens TaxID=1076330 RepID=A0ABP7VCP4_9BACI